MRKDNKLFKLDDIVYCIIFDEMHISIRKAQIIMRCPELLEGVMSYRMKPLPEEDYTFSSFEAYSCDIYSSMKDAIERAMFANEGMLVNAKEQYKRNKKRFLKMASGDENGK